MKCRECKKLLYQYIDNELKPEFASELKKHIATCAECKAELEYVKNVKKEISSLKTVKAPKDFSLRVRERIGKSSGFKRITDILFYPVKFKLPIEAAGLAVICMLILFYVNYNTGVKTAYYAKNETSVEKADSISTGKKAKLDMKKEIAVPAPVISPKRAADDRKAKKIHTPVSYEKTVTFQIAFLVKDDRPAAAPEAVYSLSKAEIAEEYEPRDYASGAKTESVNEKASGESTKPVGKKPLRSGDDKEKDDRTVQLQNNFQQLFDIVASNKGKILDGDKDKTEQDEIVTVEIPEANSKQFLVDLKNIGNVIEEDDKKVKKENKMQQNLMIEVR